MIHKKCNSKTGIEKLFFNDLNCEIKSKDILNMRGCYDRPCGEA